jgi:hypothetical protein
MLPEADLVCRNAHEFVLRLREQMAVYSCNPDPSLKLGALSTNARIVMEFIEFNKHHPTTTQINSKMQATRLASSE